MESNPTDEPPTRRVAAVDMGSNAIRFTAALFRFGRHAGRLDYVREPVRLGHNAFRSGRLSAEDLDAAVEALAGFRDRMDEAGVERYRAVATSAVREAANGGELVERALREADLEVEVIDGKAEAAIVWRAVRDRIAVEGRWLLIDLGGGSLEVSVVGPDGIRESDTYPVGTVRLLERKEGAGGAAVEALVDQLVAGAVPGGLRGVMATGGNIEALAELAEAEEDTAGVAVLPVDALSRTMEELESMSYQARVDDLGLRPDRADVIVPAGRVYRRVARLANAEEIVVPNVSVSDGILLELGRP